MTHHASYAVPSELLDVVVIDDSRNMQTIIRSMLNAMKVRRVRLFDSTEAALHAMLHEPPNLIICQWRAGLVSGHQLLRMVRARFMEPLCYVPVIIMTATPTRAIVDKAMAGFIAPQLRSHLDYMESELKTRDWFAGPEFTAADVQMSFPIEAARSRAGLNATEHPRLTDWLARIHARPAYQRAAARGGDSKPMA